MRRNPGTIEEEMYRSQVENQFVPPIREARPMIPNSPTLCVF